MTAKSDPDGVMKELIIGWRAKISLDRECITALVRYGIYDNGEDVTEEVRNRLNAFIDELEGLIAKYED